MRSIIVAIFLISARVAFAADSGDSSARDHLQSSGWGDKNLDRYSQLVESKLGLTAFDSGRAVIYPPFEGEWSVSLYSRSKGNGQRQYFVSCTKAEHNLWQRTGAFRHPEAAYDVKVTRIDAEIPMRVAKEVKDAWMTMLRGARTTGDSSTPETLGGEYVIGGLQREFSIQVPTGSALHGRLFTTPSSGTKTAALVKLVDMLADYCESESRKRPAIADKIYREAKWLLQQRD
jgi:hypothetical protein